MRVKFSARLLLQTIFRQANLQLTLSLRVFLSFCKFHLASTVSLGRSCDAKRLFSGLPFWTFTAAAVGVLGSHGG
jgi:hypothetical protein